MYSRAELELGGGITTGWWVGKGVKASYRPWDKQKVFEIIIFIYNFLSTWFTKIKFTQFFWSNIRPHIDFDVLRFSGEREVRSVFFSEKPTNIFFINKQIEKQTDMRLPYGNAIWKLSNLEIYVRKK